MVGSAFSYGLAKHLSLCSEGEIGESRQVPAAILATGEETPRWRRRREGDSVVFKRKAHIGPGSRPASVSDNAGGR